MPAGKVDLIIEQGSTFKHRLLVKQGSGASAPVLDLTGYTARMQIRQTRESQDVIASLTTENGGITITAADGQIDLTISAANTSVMNFASGVYDLEIISGSGEVTRLIQGKASLSYEVTR